MKPIPSTAEILFLKLLNEPVNEVWITWAYEMLIAGFDTENLIMLAGETAPFNQFELQRLAEKTLRELNLKWDDHKIVFKNYICYLIKLALSGKKSLNYVLANFIEFYISRNYNLEFQDFAFLYWAKEDLNNYGDQY